MLDYLIICITSLIVSIITLFSGFGLGTVLMPVFGIFFPLPIAISSTAIIHLLNNIFKAAIVGKLAKWRIVFKFGIPAALTSAFGAYLLGKITNFPPIFKYYLLGHEFKITFVGLVIGIIIIAFSFLELIPKFSSLSFPSKYIPIGGALSGFFGGIAGNQGALRTAFLIKAGLNKEEFIGTSVIASIIVDLFRILVYGWSFYSEMFAHTLSSHMKGILIGASVTAFLGSYIGSKLIKKITFNTIQFIVGVMLLILGTSIAIGLI